MPLRFLCLFLLFSLGRAFSYSVLAHEALIDALWDVKIKSILLTRFPSATPEELKRAHGFAYGGSIIQDLGYYPHASSEFSDLTHYVRTGDFILALIKDSQDLDELAFALGALSHYVGDLDGHRFATNVGEPMLYPALRKKFGDVITYEDNPVAHLKTEFGFDVLEVAKANFAPQSYHDFIGFYVAKDLVARGFRDTYGLELKDLFGNFDEAIASYRSSVSRVIPMASRIAWAQKKAAIQSSQPGISRSRFVYTMRRSSYQREWGKRYDEPSALDRFLGFLVSLLPPIGPLKALKFRMPTAPVEKLYLASFDRAVQQYSDQLDRVTGAAPQIMVPHLFLPDKNYDVGDFTPLGVYRLSDETQAHWLRQLAGKHFSTITPDIQRELLAYFAPLDANKQILRKRSDWNQLLADVAQLKSAHAPVPKPE